MKKNFCSFLYILLFTSFAFSKQINRIVSLGSSATEILFCLDAQDKIVARTDFCDYPKEASSIKSIGGFDGRAISLEAILLCKPDFVYGFKTMHDHLEAPLKSMGIKIYLSDTNSIEQIKKEIVEIGTIIGHEKQANKVINNMNRKLKEVEEFVKTKKIKSVKKEVTVFWQIWDNPIMSVGSASFINDIITYAGAKNIFFDEKTAYPIVSKEAILYRDPDFIFFTNLDLAKGISAKYGCFDLSQKVYFSRSTPRVVDAIQELAEIIWSTVK